MLDFRHEIHQLDCSQTPYLSDDHKTQLGFLTFSDLQCALLDF